MGSLLFFLYKVKQRHLAFQYKAFLVFRQKRIQTSSLCANPTPRSSFKGVLDSRTNSGSVSSVASALLPAPVYRSPLFLFFFHLDSSRKKRGAGLRVYHYVACCCGSHRYDVGRWQSSSSSLRTAMVEKFVQFIGIFEKLIDNK